MNDILVLTDTFAVDFDEAWSTQAGQTSCEGDLAIGVRSTGMCPFSTHVRCCIKQPHAIASLSAIVNGKCS